MRLLISLLFFLLASLYTLTIHKKDYTVAPYISGVLVGILVIPIALLLKLDFFNSGSYLFYSLAHFFIYFFLPSIFGLVLYFILNLKGFEPKTAPLAVAGIWTSVLVFVAYEIAKNPDSTLYFVFFVTYIFSVLAFDLLATLFHKIPKWALLLLSYLLTIPLMFIANFSFALWLYKYSPLVYLGAPSLFSIIFLVLIILLKYVQRKNDGDASSDIYGSSVYESSANYNKE